MIKVLCTVSSILLRFLNRETCGHEIAEVAIGIMRIASDRAVLPEEIREQRDMQRPTCVYVSRRTLEPVITFQILRIGRRVARSAWAHTHRRENAA